MNRLQTKTSFLDKIMATTLFEIFAVLYIAHKVLPAFGYYMPGVVYLGVFAVTFLLGFTVSNDEEKKNFTLSMLPLFLTGALTCIRYAILGNLTGVFTYIYGELQIYLYGIIAVWYIVKNRVNRAKYLFSFVMICYAVTAVTTYIGCINYPQASRTMATLSTTDALYQLYTSNNIGGFTFIYELVLILPLIIYMLKSKRINRLIGVLFTALIGMVIIQSEYATALLLFVISLILFLIPKLTGKKIIIFTVIALAIILLFRTFIAGAFDSLSSMVESETVAERFKYISDLLSGNSVDDVEGNRMELYAKSLAAFWDSAMMGVWNNGSTGGHSLILDSLGFYGIFGMFALIAIYAVMYKVFIGKHKGKDYYAYILYMYILGIFMAVINPKLNLFIFICVIPVFALVMDEKEIKENKNENSMGM